MKTKTFTARCLLLLLSLFLFGFGQVNAQADCGECRASVYDIVATQFNQCTVGLQVSSGITAPCVREQYVYDFGDGTQGVPSGSSSAMAHTFPGPGTYNVCVTMWISDGNGGDWCPINYCEQVTVGPCTNACSDCNLSVSGWQVFDISNCRKGFSVNSGINATNCSLVDYTWDFGDGSAPVTGAGNSYAHDFTSAGTYTVCVTANATNGFQMCTATVCTTIVVTGCEDECKECNISVGTPSVTNISDCRKGFTVGSSVTNPCTIPDYTWNFGDGSAPVTGSNVMAHDYTSSGTFNVCVTANGQTAAGAPCPVTACTTITVTECVDPCEACKISVGTPSVTNISDCRKGFTVGSSVTNPCSIPDYTWDFGDGTTPVTGSNVMAHDYTSSGTFTVCVTANGQTAAGEPCPVTACTTITVTGCVDPCEACKISVSTPSITNISDCRKGFGVNSSVTFPCSIPDYTWDFGDGTTPVTGGNVMAHDYTSSGTFTVCVTANGETAAGHPCPVTACTTITVTECVDPCEACDISVSTPSIAHISDCKKGFSANSSVTSPCSIPDYTWDFGDGTAPVTTSNFASHEYTSSGTYTVCITANGQTAAGVPCPVTSCTTIVVSDCGNCSTDVYEVDDTPAQANFGGGGGFQWGNLCISSGDEDWFIVNNGNFFVRITGANATVSGLYKIYFDPAIQTNCITVETLSESGSTTDTYAELFDANLNLLADDDNSGSGLFSKIEFNCNGNKKAAPAAAATVYPNPVRSGSTLNITFPEGVSSLQLIDLTGRILLEGDAQVGSQQIQVPANLSEGVYILRSPEGAFAPVRVLITD